MRHNCHIFEPEALRPDIADARRYIPLRQRSAILVQSVGSTGKSTLCNLIAASSPVFPYLLQVPACEKPSVALFTTAKTLEANVVTIPSAHGMDVSLFEGSRASFSRSFGDGMFRTSSYSSSSPSSARSSTRTDALPAPPSSLPSKRVRVSFPPSGEDTVKSMTLMQPWIEQALTPHACNTDDDRDVAFMTVKLLTGDEATRSSCEDPPLTLIESRAPDDRPAMHLTHSVVFLLSEDDAIYASRLPSSEMSSGGCSYRFGNRDAALVAQMTAVTTCDGDACKCCIVVNMGHMMRRCDEVNVTDDPHGMPKRQTSVGDNDFVDISSNGSQHPAGSDPNWLESQRTEIARRWRVADDRVFMFSTLRLLAERLVNPVVSFERADTDEAMFHLASQHERSEFFRFLRFLQNNASKASEEWKNRQEKNVERQQRVARMPSSIAATLPETPSLAPKPTDVTIHERHDATYAARPSVATNQLWDSVDRAANEVASAPVASIGPTISVVIAEAEFLNERQSRMEADSRLLAARQNSQQVSVREELAAIRAEQTEAARRVAQRHNTQFSGQ
ncbi:Hypothetical protein, putative [Bodo saltans]|uniref:Uncharacterized protein n=1 Tax=Bodo saltans TaxID=75058 RepID=A0A0S4KKA0_BODSA|nr:Hypothetical protein, putative [Bodo saltans]|eukprot:CUI15422.1 Hypothetical protein, putative [Bodo saltans]